LSDTVTTARRSPAIWLKVRYLRAKVYVLTLALNVLYRAVRFVLRRAPDQEELDLLFGEREDMDELIKVHK
jgi:hypothetical protein